MSRSMGGPDFDTLYSLHPRKKSREDALKAWRQTAKVRPPFDELLRAHARARAEWRGREARFIPYLATWLRAHGWEDGNDEESVEPVTADWYRVNSK
jgi:hypothetical protein